MEASPRTSAAPERTLPTPAPSPLAADTDILLPLRFMVLGLVFLAFTTAVLAFRPDLLVEYHYGPQIIALTHALMLGFGASIVFGAVYQLIPVVLQTRLHSPRAARFHFWCQLIGVPGMVAMFWIWNMKQVGHFGSLFALGVFVFAWNVWKTVRQAPRRDVVTYGIVSSTAWLTLATLAGLFLASAKCWPPINPIDPLAGLHAHAHLGVLGGFITLIVGVSYRLVPMFLLSEVASLPRARASLHLLNAGLLGVLPAIALKSPWKLVFALVVGTGLFLFLIEIREMVARRRRAHLDWGLRMFLAAVGLLLPLIGLAGVLCAPGLPMTDLTLRLENVYALLALFGVLVGAILGMLHKILPFLVWFRVYSPWIGRRKVPALHELSSPSLQGASAWTYSIGLVGAAVGIAVGSHVTTQIFWGVLGLGLLLVGANALRTLSHLAGARPGSTAAPVTRPLASSTHHEPVPS